MAVTILGIETSCDDTSAAVLSDGILLSNVIADQDVHKAFGGVVPELASRAHQQNIIPVVDQAIERAGIKKEEISGIAFTRGPGLMGSLLVGSSFAKGFALALNIPLIGINHLQAHILVHFIKEKNSEKQAPSFPFLCLLASGGHTQLVVVKSPLDMTIIGQTLDDAAGEAFDKCGKLIGLLYPGGPAVDQLAQEGDPSAFSFPTPRFDSLDFSFSGLKTAFLYFLRDHLKNDPDFVSSRLKDICASLQKTITDMLTDNLIKASHKTGIKEIAIAGGVAANSTWKQKIQNVASRQKWNIYLPEKKFTTDNAAMVAVAGYFKYLAGQFSGQDTVPQARLNE